MKKFSQFLIFIFSFFLLVDISFAEDVTTTKTFVVEGPYNDGYTALRSGKTHLTKSFMYIGKNFFTAWRFENFDIPQGAKILGAKLETFCGHYSSNAITIRYMGQASDNAEPFSESPYDLSNRPVTWSGIIDSPEPWQRMAWNASPDLSSILEEIVDRPGWKSGNALALFAVNEASKGKRVVYTCDQTAYYGARLIVTYSFVPPAACEFDTNGDGVVDLRFKDTDGDGYCEIPPGKIEYWGTLVINKPVELMGKDGEVRTGTLFKGDGFILTQGGEIISDLVSPVVSSAYPGLRGIDLEVLARNLIQVEYNGKVDLGGISGELTGDVLFETTRIGADVMLKENGIIYGRHIDIKSDGGSIYIERNTNLNGCSDMNLIARKGDINLSREAKISLTGNCGVYFATNDGDMNLTRNVSIAADKISMCDVNGKINDDGTTSFIGTILY